MSPFSTPLLKVYVGDLVFLCCPGAGNYRTVILKWQIAAAAQNLRASHYYTFDRFKNPKI
jgi:hypothetical protein